MELQKAENAPKTSSVNPLAPKLPDGTKLATQIPQQFASNDPNYNRPQHSYTQSTVAPTAEYTRYLGIALPTRYLFRSAFDSAFLNENAFSWLQNPINKWIDKKYVNPLAREIETTLKEGKLHQDAAIKNILKETTTSGHGKHYAQMVGELQDYFEKTPPDAFKNVEKLLDKKGALGRMAPEITSYAMLSGKLSQDNPLNLPQVRTKSRMALRKAIRSNMGHIGYGLSLGVGSLALGLSYSYTVYKDMQHLFTESVAYELDKDPEKITIRDILSSENKIINTTAKNFWMKLAERVGLALPFFAVARTIRYGLADFTVGLTSARLLQETWNRKPTMFEDLVGFVNHKINPQNGLGQPITVAEIFDLYQHYSYYNQKDKAFVNVVNTNNDEAKRWSESQILFERIAQLMNHSYAYKHTTQYDEQGNVVKLANFTLPKFIYLLGHGMIDAHDPAKSLAYVEIANAHGIQSVKQAKAAFDDGADLQTVRDQFNLGVSDIRKLREHITNAVGNGAPIQTGQQHNQNAKNQASPADTKGTTAETTSSAEKNAPDIADTMQNGNIILTQTPAVTAEKIARPKPAPLPKPRPHIAADTLEQNGQLHAATTRHQA